MLQLKIYEKTKQIFNNNLKFTDGMKQKELLEKINSNEIIKGPLFNGLENSASQNIPHYALTTFCDELYVLF